MEKNFPKITLRSFDKYRKNSPVITGGSLSHIEEK